MDNRIQRLHAAVNDAVSNLSEAHNGWTFPKLAAEGRWCAVHSGHKEAEVRVEVLGDDSIKFTVYDQGVIRFNDGTTEFSFVMPYPIVSGSDETEETFLDAHLIAKLDSLHGLT